MTLPIAIAKVRSASNSVQTLGEVSMGEATQLMSHVDRGDPQAADQLLELVYAELRALASHRISQEQPGQTLQPTALVHEAWIKLVGSESRTFANRAHFFSAASEAMRRILIDRARRRRTERHGGAYERVNLDGLDIPEPQADEELLALNAALDVLAQKHPAQAEVVKLKYFGGQTYEEIAAMLGISVSTVKNYWNFARAWLFNAIQQDRQ